MAIGSRSDPTALDVLAQDLNGVGLRKVDVIIAGEADPKVRWVDEGFEVSDDGDTGCDACRVMAPARDLFLRERPVRLPVGSQITAYGWTTQADRLSQLIPLSQPLSFVIECHFTPVHPTR